LRGGKVTSILTKINKLHLQPEHPN